MKYSINRSINLWTHRAGMPLLNIIGDVTVDIASNRDVKMGFGIELRSLGHRTRQIFCTK